MDEEIIILRASSVKIKSLSLYPGGDEETLGARWLASSATCIFLKALSITSMTATIIDVCDLVGTHGASGIYVDAVIPCEAGGGPELDQDHHVGRHHLIDAGVEMKIKMTGASGGAGRTSTGCVKWLTI